MKPLKLVMNAFGPFVTRQEIDFTEISGDNIFLVTGETGAGKTTIFDAMSFALYGSASGGDRKPGSFKSDHAAANELCYVEFSFTLHGRKYFLRRSPAQPGVKRDGSPKDIAPSAELTLPDGELVTGANSVTERIEQILGLSHKQFKQTIMLAQGEFKQLIEANGKEKQQIFSKIFGTSIYSDLTESLVRAESDLQRITQSSREAVARCIHELASYGHSALNDVNAVFFPYKQIAELISDTMSLYEAESLHLDEDISLLEVEKAKLDPERARTLNEKFNRRDALQSKLSELTSYEPQIAQTEAKIKLLTSALELKGQETFILELKSQSRIGENKITQLEANLASLIEKEQMLFANQDRPTSEETALTQRLAMLESRYESLYRDFLDGQAGILATGLKDGEPCPVCGATHHVKPAEPPSSAPTEKSVNDAKNAVSLASKQLETHREKVKKAYWQAKSDREKHEAGLNAAKAHNDTILNQFQIQRAAFKEKLRTSGFKNYEAYSAALSDEAELPALKQEVENHRRNCVEIMAQLGELERDVKGRVREDAGAIQAASNDISLRLAALRERKNELYAVLTGSKKRLAELKQLCDKNIENDRKYAIAHELAALAKGSRTVSFERYILAAYFDDIIKLSNIHLQLMTASRYRLRRLDNSERGAGSGLDMEIIDSYTGKSRDVATLSGGESFKASLALALGLSGVVQIYSGGVSIDTMFIDEGFGSLDEKSLDSAVETLISLKNSGRMVGIISHVPALRGYIHKKLAVRYSPTGSTIEWQ